MQGSRVLNEQLGGGPLSDNGFQVRLNGQPLDSEAQNSMLQYQRFHKNSSLFPRDVLWRDFLFESEEMMSIRQNTWTSEGDENIRVVSLCDNVGGVSHTKDGSNGIAAITRSCNESKDGCDSGGAE